jgi:hypothetical protein
MYFKGDLGEGGCIIRWTNLNGTNVTKNANYKLAFLSLSFLQRSAEMTLQIELLYSF